MSRSRRLGLLISSLSLVLSLDIASKYLAEKYLSDGSLYPLIPSVLELKLSYNSGIAFSLPLTGLPLIGVTITLMTLLIAASIYLTLQDKKTIHSHEIIGYGLLIGGGMGNALERIIDKRVVDFLNVPFFANCNIADVGITLGVILIIIASLSHHTGSLGQTR